MANTTTSYLLFKPRSGVVDDKFLQEIEMYKQQFQVQSVCYRLYQCDEYGYSCGMRYNHHDLDTYIDSCKGLDSLLIAICVFTEDYDDPGEHYEFSTSKITRILTTDQVLSSEDCDLKDLYE